MVKKGQTWGILTSGWVSVVLEIDWSAGDRDGDVVYYYIIDDCLNLDLPNNMGSCVITYPEIFALLAACNAEIGLTGHHVFLRLCKKISKEYIPVSPPSQASSEQTDAESVPTLAAHPAPTQLPHRVNSSHDSFDVAAALSWMADNELRTTIDDLIRPEPGFRYVFTRQERLDSVLRAIADRQSGQAQSSVLVGTLKRILEAAYFDPYANLSGQNRWTPTA